MKPSADLSQRGVARLLGEFIERLDLNDVTRVLNDWGGGQFLVDGSEESARRIRRLVLVACVLAWSERLRTFDRPVLVVWATEDALMPREHGRRLAELHPQGRLVEVADSSTLIPEDQPERLVEVLTDFLLDTGAEPAPR